MKFRVPLLLKTSGPVGALLKPKNEPLIAMVPAFQKPPPSAVAVLPVTIEPVTLVVAAPETCRPPPLPGVVVEHPHPPFCAPSEPVT